MQLLLALVEECGVAARRHAISGGEKINIAERRAVLQVALRGPRGAEPRLSHDTSTETLIERYRRLGA